MRFVVLLTLAAACMPDARPTVGLRWLVEDPSQRYHVFAVGPTGDVYAAGDSQDRTDLWVTKYSHVAGEPAWTLHITGGAWMPHLATDRDNNLLVTGYTAGSVDFGGMIVADPGTAFVAKLDPDGQLLWVRALGTGSSCGLAVAASPDARIYAAGDCGGMFTFGSSTVDCSAISFYLAALEPDGTPRWAASTRSTNLLPFIAAADDRVAISEPDGFGTFVASFDSDGRLDWSKMLDSGWQSATASDGELVVGDSETLTAYDPHGDKLWRRWRTDPQQLDALAITPAGTIVVPASPSLDLYGLDGTIAGDRALIAKSAAFEWAASTADGAVAFKTSAAQIGLTEPIE